MGNLNSLELKTFVPAKDFAQAKAFYQALGFRLAWEADSVACFNHGHCSFLLQDFYQRELAENLMLHLLVEDVDAWWQQVQDSGLVERFGVRLHPLEDQPWGMRDFVLIDPSGVLWRIGQSI
ncbi:MAG TPA: VOC family protein [Pseudomonas sp.]|nr:VOC family protein [Pseudomonas sp.]